MEKLLWYGNHRLYIWQDIVCAGSFPALNFSKLISNVFRFRSVKLSLLVALLGYVNDRGNFRHHEESYQLIHCKCFVVENLAIEAGKLFISRTLGWVVWPYIRQRELKANLKENFRLDESTILSYSYKKP